MPTSRTISPTSSSSRLSRRPRTASWSGRSPPVVRLERRSARSSCRATWSARCGMRPSSKAAGCGSWRTARTRRVSPCCWPGRTTSRPQIRPTATSSADGRARRGRTPKVFPTRRCRRGPRRRGGRTTACATSSPTGTTQPATDGSDEPPPVERPLIAVLGTRDDDVEAWLAAGQGVGRLLLAATAHGVTASPMTQPLEIPDTRQRLVSQLGAGRPCADDPAPGLRRRGADAGDATTPGRGDPHRGARSGPIALPLCRGDRDGGTTTWRSS